MEYEHSVDLTELPRLFHYPYQLAELGWLPHHRHRHDHAVTDSCFICLSCNFTEISESLVNGVPHRSGPGQLPTFSILLPGVTLHTLQVGAHDELFFRYPAECAPRLLELLRPALGNENNFCFQGFPQETLAVMRHTLADLARPGSADLLDQLAIRLMCEIVIRRMSLPAEAGAHSVRLHAIAAGLCQGEALEKLLRHHGYSERSFYREWQRLFGISPRQYVLRQRLERACSLLAGSALTPAEIAEACGFQETAHFYKVFRQHLGTTPRRYRSAHSGTLLPPCEIE